MISSAHIVDLKGNVISGHTICPPSFVDIALIFSELRGGAESPPPQISEDQKKPGLNRVIHMFCYKLELMAGL